MEDITSKIIEVAKPWGNFRQFTHNTSSTVKIITVKPNEELSLQSHTKRAEFWKVISGSGSFVIGEETHMVATGDEYTIAQGARHRISSGVEGMSVLEIALGDFDEEDIIRYEDKYGRA